MMARQVAEAGGKHQAAAHLKRVSVVTLAVSAAILVIISGSAGTRVSSTVA